MPFEKKLKFQPKIVVSGAGRVACALAKRLAARGCPPVQIFNRTAAAAEKLAAEIGCDWTSDFQKIVPSADLYILAVRDDAIEFLAENLSKNAKNGLTIHLSGGTPRQVLDNFFEKNGVCWPLQTFSEGKKIVWKTLPVCCAASGYDELIFLKKFVHLLGARFVPTDDEQRARLHVAAVFANNFTNHCLAIAEKLLADADLSPSLIRPLVAETFNKFEKMSAREAQTGPARRGDRATIERHLALLETDPSLQKIYQNLSENIAAMAVPNAGEA